MSEMIERVTQALMDAELKVPAKATTGELWNTLARAAIQAMREPTDAMTEAGDAVFRCERWEAMIDAALKEGE